MQFRELQQLGYCAVAYGFYNTDSEIAYTTNCSLCADPKVVQYIHGVILTGNTETVHMHNIISIDFPRFLPPSENPPEPKSLRLLGGTEEQSTSRHIAPTTERKRKKTTYETGISMTQDTATCA